MKKNVYDFKSDLGRLTPDPATGLTREQVDTRIAQGLTNEVKNKASKSYFRIFFDNICTFFNLFCLICFGVMLTVPGDVVGLFVHRYLRTEHGDRHYSGNKG